MSSRGHDLGSNLVGTNGFNGGRLSKDKSDGRQGDAALSQSFSRASLMGSSMARQPQTAEALLLLHSSYQSRMTM